MSSNSGNNSRKDLAKAAQQNARLIRDIKAGASAYRRRSFTAADYKATEKRKT